MVLTRLCCCGHPSGYHQSRQNYVKRGSERIYTHKSFHQCNMDFCDCEKFDLKEEKQITYHSGRDYATD